MPSVDVSGHLAPKRISCRSRPRSAGRSATRPRRQDWLGHDYASGRHDGDCTRGLASVQAMANWLTVNPTVGGEHRQGGATVRKVEVSKMPPYYPACAGANHRRQIWLRVLIVSGQRRGQRPYNPAPLLMFHGINSFAVLDPATEQVVRGCKVLNRKASPRTPPFSSAPLFSGHADLFPTSFPVVAPSRSISPPAVHLLPQTILFVSHAPVLVVYLLLPKAPSRSYLSQLPSPRSRSRSLLRLVWSSVPPLPSVSSLSCHVFWHSRVSPSLTGEFVASSCRGCIPRMLPKPVGSAPLSK